MVGFETGPSTNRRKGLSRFYPTVYSGCTVTAGDCIDRTKVQGLLT